MDLIIGYGNSMRSDDGAGIYAAQRIADENLPGVVVITMHQLHVEILEDAVRYDRIILVDASEDGEAVCLRKVGTASSGEMTSTHHLSAELFADLARIVYGRDLNLYLCSIKGKNFEMGDHLSRAVRSRAQKAVELIHQLILGDLAYA